MIRLYRLLSPAALLFASLAAYGESPETAWLTPDPPALAVQHESSGTAVIAWSESPEGPVYLEFDAWVETPKVAGYRGAFLIFWNGKEPEDSGQRLKPGKFGIQDGRAIPYFAKRLGWTVPKAPGLEVLRSYSGPYKPVDELFHPWRFRFLLPHTPAGEHEIRWQSTLPADEGTLRIENIRLIRQP